MDELKNETPSYVKRLAKQLAPTADVVKKTLKSKERIVHLLYLKSVVDMMQLQEIIVKPFYELSKEQNFAEYIRSLPYETPMPSGDQEVLIEITKGNVFVMIDKQITLLELKMLSANAVQDAKMEPTIHGPQLGLSESIETNINVIRQRYHQPSLVVETMQLDEASNRTVVLLYDKDNVRSGLLENIYKRLKSIDVQLIQGSGDLQYHLNNAKYSLFPTSLLTERPDRILYSMTAGKVIIMVDGSPHAIIAPTVFFDFIVSMEDEYYSFWVVTLIRILRYGGLITCIVLPALYVGVTSYTPDVFRTELALTVAASRIGVPYPSFIEVFFMLVFIELLTEASMRLPNTISATATTVGGLILGTAAVEAALTSNILVIVVSLVAISTFVIPISEMNYAVRVCRFLLLVYTTAFGLAGLVLGMLGLLIFLVNKDSFGEPYLRMFWKSNQEELKADDR
ncbi:spore germination protein [Sporosarcina sp. PTS2304]|uniref:spore germination protein n=1 Tax=Sporosarcina sp. PTS2304 TaxID=2283194 RepID=UPI000E0DB556|nr:spore germination protein [Sporosarcina sp. PTS2304]AXI00097.1 spore germination protein [Sporosarcina sp. PTS2304]